MNLYTISALCKEIYSLFLLSYPQSIKVEGEVSNFKASSNGHWYFTLKDEYSQIQTVMFKKDNSVCSLPKNGDKVEVTASVSFYQVRGDCQLVCQTMSPRGLGALLAMLEARKTKFAEEGYFDVERKQPLPLMPQRIGLVTSSQAAALQDMLKIFTQRQACVHVYIFPAMVQGDTAGQDIANKIAFANKFRVRNMSLDVIIVSRGGGSTEDLLAFSDEAVLFSIANAEVPIISAVGHEIDTPLSDYVADIVVPTPTAAASLIVEQIASTRDRILQMFESLIFLSTKKIEQLTKQVAMCSPLSLVSSIKERTNYLRQKVDTTTEMLTQKILHNLYDVKHKILLYKETIDASSPHTILSKGYALISDKDSRQLVQSVKELRPQKEVVIMLQDGAKNAIIN